MSFFFDLCLQKIRSFLPKFYYPLLKSSIIWNIINIIGLFINWLTQFFYITARRSPFYFYRVITYIIWNFYLLYLITAYPLTSNRVSYFMRRYFWVEIFCCLLLIGEYLLKLFHVLYACGNFVFIDSILQQNLIHQIISLIRHT